MHALSYLVLGLCFTHRGLRPESAFAGETFR
jgi:hypothetical protein